MPARIRKFFWRRTKEAVARSSEVGHSLVTINTRSRSPCGRSVPFVLGRSLIWARLVVEVSLRSGTDGHAALISPVGQSRWWTDAMGTGPESGPPQPQPARVFLPHLRPRSRRHT